MPSNPNQAQSLVHLLPKYLQSPYWVPGIARYPGARLRPTAYSGGHGCQSSCLHKGKQWYVLSQRPEVVTSLPIFADFKCFPILHLSLTWRVKHRQMHTQYGNIYLLTQKPPSARASLILWSHLVCTWDFFSASWEKNFLCPKTKYETGKTKF